MVVLNSLPAEIENELQRVSLKFRDDVRQDAWVAFLETNQIDDTIRTINLCTQRYKRSAKNHRAFTDDELEQMQAPIENVPDVCLCPDCLI